MVDIEQWLGQQGLGQYAARFIENDIDDEILAELTESDLERLGVASLGHRKKLLKAIGLLQAGGPDAGTAQPQIVPASDAPAPEQVTAAERRQLTVMFCDLVGSTQLSQRLDPEDLREVITVCQQAWAKAIERYEGFVAKYMGDGLLAYFGYPRAHEDDAERALHAALAVAEGMADVNSGAAPGNLDLAVRIGVATGPVVVGDVLGEGASRENPVVGETPNLAARLQAMAEPDTVVVSELTHQLAGDWFDFGDLGFREAKGLAEPVHVWLVAGHRPMATRFEAGHPGRLTPLLGREHELGLLLERWELAKAGEGQVVLVSGEPGVGKSRVSQTLQRRLVQGEHVHVDYQCSPHHSNSALYPFITCIERDAGFEPGDAAAVRLRKLERLLKPVAGAADRYLPIMAALLSVPVGDRYPAVDLSTQRQKDEMLRLLAAQIGESGQGRPLLILFEDAHWADATSLELLDILIEQVQDLPALLLITARPEFESQWSSRAHVTSLVLNRFSRPLVTAMVRAIAEPHPLSDEVVAQIVARSDGNPLFVEELTQSVLETYSENPDTGVDPARGRQVVLSIPATLHDSLMARLDRVPMARELAQCAAVIGREFSREFLAVLAPVSGQDFLTALDQLIEADVVFRRGGLNKGLFVFKHALVRDAAYESLLKRRQRQLHLRIANALRERLESGEMIEFELIAHHFTQACAYPEAIEYWHRAGQHAARQSANREAAEHLRHGIELLGELEETDDLRRRELAMQVALGSVLESTLGFAAPSVGQTHRRAQLLCEQLDDTDQLTRVLYGLAHFHMVRAELATACRIGERCMKLANELKNPGYLVDARLVLGASLGHRGRLDAARGHLEGGLAQYTGEHDTAHAYRLALDTDVFGRSFLGHVLWLLGYPSQAQQQLRKAVSIATAQSDPFSSARAWAYTTMLNQFMRAAEETMYSASQTIAICEEHHFEYYGAWGQFMHAWAVDQLGGDGDTTADLKSALERLTRTGAGLRRSYYLGLLAQAHGARGEPAAGLALIDDALEDVAQTEEKWTEPELYRIRAGLLLQDGPPAFDEAERSLRRAVACADSQKAISLQLRALVTLARLLRDRGERGQAGRLLYNCYKQFTEGFETVDLQEAKTLLDEFM